MPRFRSFDSVAGVLMIGRPSSRATGWPQVGQAVSAGQELLVLEAMKMNNFITAPRDGTVAAFHVAAGDVVAEGQPLLSLA